MAILNAYYFSKCIEQVLQSSGNKANLIGLLSTGDFIQTPCWEFAKDAMTDSAKAIIWWVCRALLMKNGYNPFTGKPYYE
jgi:hypothetical protein